MRHRYWVAVAAMATLVGGASSSYGGEFGPAEYVANVRQHAAFIEQSSRLAAARSADAGVQAFAKAQSDEQQAVAGELRAWEAALPTGGLTSPATVATNDRGSLDPDGVVTGRSAAVDGSGDSGVLMAAPGVVVLPQLSALKGEKFDELYEATQEASLKELAGLYEAYGMTGSDPTLRALAMRELPKIKQRLSELDAL